ncbi:radical SAM protein [Patescibacteria group bacterium]|nr:radical SAM protein [Patescibacteria group bacterium]MCL5091945.1 radical SAM protein [Patescibacteria group bacterium]
MLEGKSYDLVHLLPTNQCNLGCNFCLASSGKVDPEEMNKKQVLNVVEQLGPIDYKYMHLEGGEPFVSGNLFEILTAFRRLGKLGNITIITNGTVPIDGYEKLLPEVDGVMFSFDNHRPQGGRYLDILPNIIAFRDHGVPVKLRTTVTRSNIDFMEEVVRIALANRIPTVRFGAYKVLGRGARKKVRDEYALGEEDYLRLFDETHRLIQRHGNDLTIKLSTPASFTLENDGNRIYQMAKRHQIGQYSKLEPCFAYHRQFNISPNGDVTQCNESRTPLVLGNVITDPLQTILTRGENIFRQGHGCTHGHLLISSNPATFNMQ